MISHFLPLYIFEKSNIVYNSHACKNDVHNLTFINVFCPNHPSRVFTDNRELFTGSRVFCGSHIYNKVSILYKKANV